MTNPKVCICTLIRGSFLVTLIFFLQQFSQVHRSVFVNKHEWTGNRRYFESTRDWIQEKDRIINPGYVPIQNDTTTTALEDILEENYINEGNYSNFENSSDIRSNGAGLILDGPITEQHKPNVTEESQCKPSIKYLFLCMSQSENADYRKLHRKLWTFQMSAEVSGCQQLLLLSLWLYISNLTFDWFSLMGVKRVSNVREKKKKKIRKKKKRKKKRSFLSQNSPFTFFPSMGWSAFSCCRLVLIT